MHRPALMKLVLVVGVLVVMTLALTGYSSGGSAQEEAKARPLPLYATEKTLRPGEYHSVKFKPPSPSRSARAGQTPKISCPTLSN
jgi:hypothetical protein